MVSDRDQPPEFLPLRGLANFVTVLLASAAAAIAADAGSMNLLAVAGVALIAMILTGSGGPVGSPLWPGSGAPAAWPLLES